MQDICNNVTRMVVLSRTDAPIHFEAGRTKTSIVFCPSDRVANPVVKALQCFHAEGIEVVNMHIRPRQKLPFLSTPVRWKLSVVSHIFVFDVLCHLTFVLLLLLAYKELSNSLEGCISWLSYSAIFLDVVAHKSACGFARALDGIKEVCGALWLNSVAFVDRPIQNFPLFLS